VARAELRDDSEATPCQRSKTLRGSLRRRKGHRMSDLTLRPTWLDSPCGRPIDDFSVRHAGRPVGRIYQTCGPQRIGSGAFTASSWVHRAGSRHRSRRRGLSSRQPIVSARAPAVKDRG
jgi:hypothetical protein